MGRPHHFQFVLHNYPRADSLRRAQILDLDLPAIYTRPSASVLVSTLRELALQPLDFVQIPNSESCEDADGTYDNNHSIEAIEWPLNGTTTAQYLISIIKSPLSWIDSDVQREQIWELASARLSERAGRTAMPSVTRTFSISRAQSGGTGPDTDLRVTLFEPSLTADNLGHKTWSASYLLSRRLLDLHQHIKPHEKDQGLRVLELGSGTGLLGIAFGSLIPRAEIDLTDLPEIIPNLAQNLKANEYLLRQVGSSGSAFALDWAQAVPQEAHLRYDVILAADPIYSSDHPPLLANVVDAYLALSNDARLVLGLPMRDAYVTEVDDLRCRLSERGMILTRQGEEVGLDDWQEKNGERALVKCWWGIWSRKNRGAEL